jgi:hypothetical protein
MVKGGGQTLTGSSECREILQRPNRLFAEDIDEDVRRSEAVTAWVDAGIAGAVETDGAIADEFGATSTLEAASRRRALFSAIEPIRSPAAAP